MCQAAPLARCANHTKKELAKVEKQSIDLSGQKLSLSEEIVDLKSQARADGFSEDEIMDRSNPKLSRLNKVRREWDRLDYKSNELVRDTWEQELHMDATPTGRKELEANPGLPMQGFRLKNADAMNKWHKTLREAKDSNGNKILSPEADAEERRAFLLKEAKAAKEGYRHENRQQEVALERIELINEQLDKYETRTLGPKDPKKPGQRAYSRVAVHDKDQEEVDYLERQKSSCIVMQQQAHHNQVLERAKLNRVRKAIQLDDEKQEKIQDAKRAEEQRAIKYAENKVIASQYSEDLEKASVKLVWSSRDAKDPDESMRLSAKAAAVKTSSDRYKEFRSATHGDEAKAVASFRAKTEESYFNARRLQEEAEKSGNKSDLLIYTGERQGLSLVLDKIRSLS